MPQCFAYINANAAHSHHQAHTNHHAEDNVKLGVAKSRLLVHKPFKNGFFLIYIKEHNMQRTMLEIGKSRLNADITLMIKEMVTFSMPVSAHTMQRTLLEAGRKEQVNCTHNAYDKRNGYCLNFHVRVKTKLVPYR